MRQNHAVIEFNSVFNGIGTLYCLAAQKLILPFAKSSASLITGKTRSWKYASRTGESFLMQLKSYIFQSIVRAVSIAFHVGSNRVMDYLDRVYPQSLRITFHTFSGAFLHVLSTP